MVSNPFSCAAGVSVRAACAAALLTCVPAFAQAPDQFDKPTAVRNVKPKPDDSTEIRCTYFSDLMVREAQDGPESENAAIVRNPKAACTTSEAPGATLLDTAGMTFDGRKGSYLLFSDLDPHGATGFVIIDTKTGHILLRDAAMSHPVLQTLTLENGSLRLRYRRGVNAPCSLMQDAKKCWSQLVTEKLVPADLPAPSAQICSEAYNRDNAPPNNPSIVVYATEVIVDTGGKTRVLSRGAVECESMP